MARRSRKTRTAAPAGADRMRRGYARAEERNAAVRATLTPLAPGERPPALKVAIAVALLLAAWGMWQRRYWAVLGFATLMALITVAFSLLLLVASNVLAVVICLAFAGSAGWLFWKLIRVMGRLQAPQRVS